MVYTDHKGKKTFFIILLLIILGGSAYYFVGTQIKDFLNKNLLSQVTTFTSVTDTTTTPADEKEVAFREELTNILKNHEASSDKTQPVRRAQTTKSLLEAFVNQL